MNIINKIADFFTTLQKFHNIKNYRKKLQNIENRGIERQSNYFLKDVQIKTADEIEKVKFELEKERTNFNWQTDEDLISSSIYKLESLEKKFEFLIKKAKENSLKCDEQIVFVMQ